MNIAQYAIRFSQCQRSARLSYHQSCQDLPHTRTRFRRGKLRRIAPLHSPLTSFQDYHNVHGGHWLIDSKISTPMSQYEEYRKSRTSWGINVLGSFCVELEATDGTKGFATGFGGPPACWLVAEHFERFLIGKGWICCFNYLRGSEND